MESDYPRLLIGSRIPLEPSEKLPCFTYELNVRCGPRFFSNLRNYQVESKYLQ